jgi:hypothetical protein
MVTPAAAAHMAVAMSAPDLNESVILQGRFFRAYGRNAQPGGRGPRHRSYRCEHREANQGNMFHELLLPIAWLRYLIQVPEWENVPSERWVRILLG